MIALTLGCRRLLGVRGRLRKLLFLFDRRLLCNSRNLASESGIETSTETTPAAIFEVVSSNILVTLDAGTFRLEALGAETDLAGFALLGVLRDPLPSDLALAGLGLDVFRELLHDVLALWSADCWEGRGSVLGRHCCWWMDVGKLETFSERGVRGCANA